MAALPVNLSRAELVELTGYTQACKQVEELKRQGFWRARRNPAGAVVLEAAHQRERWGSAHDAGKAPQDWFWLLGYLGGKALAAHSSGNTDKALHHTISSAAALANWHAAISGASSSMRPGIDPVERGIGAAAPEEQA